MGELVKEYFSSLFSMSSPTGFDEILEGILPTISEEINIGFNHELRSSCRDLTNGSPKSSRV